MEIWCRETGKEYPKKYDWGKEEYWNNQLKEILARIGIKEEFKIAYVCIGNASYPINEIILTNGLKLYDEENSPAWVDIENAKAIGQFRKEQLTTK